MLAAKHYCDLVTERVTEKSKVLISEVTLTTFYYQGNHIFALRVEINQNSISALSASD